MDLPFWSQEEIPYCLMTFPSILQWLLWASYSKNTFWKNLIYKSMVFYYCRSCIIFADKAIGILIARQMTSNPAILRIYWFLSQGVERNLQPWQKIGLRMSLLWTLQQVLSSQQQWFDPGKKGKGWIIGDSFPISNHYCWEGKTCWRVHKRNIWRPIFFQGWKFSSTLRGRNQYMHRVTGLLKGLRFESTRFMAPLHISSSHLLLFFSP